MVAQRRRFTVEEKLNILQQATQSGIAVVLRKHNLSYSVFHRWKEKFNGNTSEDAGLRGGKDVQYRIRELLEENTLLKKIISNQAMLIEMKDEAMKKSRT